MPAVSPMKASTPFPAGEQAAKLGTKTYSKRQQPKEKKRKVEPVKAGDEETLAGDGVVGLPPTLGNGYEPVQRQKSDGEGGAVVAGNGEKDMAGSSSVSFEKVIEGESSLSSVPQTPSTPPRPPRHRVRNPTTPRSSPRDLSDLFPHSPRSASSLNRDEETVSLLNSPSRPLSAKAGGMRRMLTKTQSLGVSPHKSDQGSPFGKSIANGSAPGTPTKSLRASRSTPEPIKRSRSPTPSKSPSPENDSVHGSGGRAKRTYGRVRTFLVDPSEEQLAEVVDEQMKESYAELRKKYEVDNTGFEGEGAGNLISVSGPSQACVAVILISEELLMAKAPQPVADMRSKGENRRYMDELAYHLDGLADPLNSIALKRSRRVIILHHCLFLIPKFIGHSGEHAR